MSPTIKKIQSKVGINLLLDKTISQNKEINLDSNIDSPLIDSILSARKILANETQAESPEPKPKLNIYVGIENPNNESKNIIETIKEFYVYIKDKDKITLSGESFKITEQFVNNLLKNKFVSNELGDYICINARKLANLANLAQK